MPEMTLDPLVGRVRDAIRDADRPRPTFEDLTRDLRHVDAPKAIDQLAKSTGGKDQAWEELLTLVLAAAGRRVVRPLGL